MIDEKILGVVVTFNRKELVPQTLAALRGQTRALDGIILIDNASTDGTPEVLREHGILDDPRIDYVRMDRNTGGAGGFHEGMKRALEVGADWIWVMDDDVAPAPDCLEILLRWRHVSECLHPRRKLPDGSDVGWEQVVDIFTCASTMLGNISFDHGKEITFVRVACFEGMLVSRRIVTSVGLPDPKYFIGSDDTYFGLVAATYTNNAYVRDATMTRLLAATTAAVPWRVYYAMRNRFYLLRDLTERLGLHPYRSTVTKFVLLQVFDLVLSLRHGRRYFTSALRGFRHGLRYLRRKG